MLVLKRVLVDGFSVGQLHTKRQGVALPTYRYRFRQAPRRYVARPGPQQVAHGPLVLLADGLWFEFDGIPWVLYLTALKPCRGNHATFLDPLLLPGKEGASRWQQAVQAIPPGAANRIRALVADNLPGMQKIARQHQWALQLCHFHLLLKLQSQRDGVRYVLRGGAIREEIHKLIHKALTLPDGNQLRHALDRLHFISQGNCGTERTRITIEEFLRTVSYYRNYLTEPSLGLPHTNNTVESMCRVIREMFRSSRCWLKPGLRIALGNGAHSTPIKDRLQRTSNQQISFTHPQFATSNTGRGGRRYLPYAFTEHGAIQAANVLNGPRAVEMGIYVVRAFVQLRELLSSNKDLARRLDQLEARIEKKLATHDDAIDAMLSAIRQLMNPPAPKRRPIGFTATFDEKP